MKKKALILSTVLCMSMAFGVGAATTYKINFNGKSNSTKVLDYKGKQYITVQDAVKMFGGKVTKSGAVYKVTSKDYKPYVAPVRKEITLSSGNYIAGKDFVEGRYTIVAVEGNGNVSSSNLFDGGINAIMGVGGTGFDEFYEKEYKNISLPKGTTLTISSVTVKLIPVN